MQRLFTRHVASVSGLGISLRSTFGQLPFKSGAVGALNYQNMRVFICQLHFGTDTTPFQG